MNKRSHLSFLTSSPESAASASNRARCRSRRIVRWFRSDDANDLSRSNVFRQPRHAISMRERRSTRRSGLSLLEVLISLGLSMVLLSSVYAAISLYYRNSHSGQEEIEHNQLARVLLQRIELDLRSISFREKSVTASTSSSTAPMDNENGLDGLTGEEKTTAPATSTVTTPDDAFSSSDSGLFGDTQTLVLHVSRPDRELGSLQQLAAQSAGQRTSDLKTVAFFVAGAGSGGLQAIAAAQFASQSKNGTLQTRGLARMEGERLALQMADKQGSVGSLLSQTQMLAPEVSRIAFRYFDGSLWTTQWDSATYGGLPRAVEVTLELSFESKTTGQGRYKRTVTPKPKIFRTVVPLPLSKPLLESTPAS